MRIDAGMTKLWPDGSLELDLRPINGVFGLGELAAEWSRNLGRWSVRRLAVSISFSVSG